MADVSKYLALVLIDPAEDGDEAVNLFTHFNLNWVKVDAAFGDLDVPALELGLESTDVAGILTELADRVIALEEANENE